ncbi:deoxynucleoside triphosphate triphosphohydrolase SAMHD1-like [Mytilus californianus]|uniref:deoxynucleoside triphosphate triphosphohydrolase SAMHD1-like n=1 Tax=Mytilus californianus TaxID=6549 RepID=UPI0022451A54|nr:deoxynucleoside triphosphate triphosphohydrolase SAMHD1-like [Mytilus californianus]XP_052062380.1 deoxynucleoside triphosphate triphosphohydrolase SAMHD1-like [Mytilus californianus]
MEKLEKERLYGRLQQFYDEIVMLVVHIYFEREFLQNGDLNTFLQNKQHKHALFHEFFPKTKCCECKGAAQKPSERKVCLGKYQFNKLYVSSVTEVSNHKEKKGSIITQHCLCKFQPRQQVKVEDLDIILVYAIHSSCFGAVSPPGDPQLFSKIKDIRNDIAHVGRGDALSLEDFNAKWDILEQSSLEIAKLTCESHQQGIKKQITNLNASNDLFDKIKAAAKDASTEIKEILLTVLKNFPTVILDEIGLIIYQREQLTYKFKNLDVQIATRTSNGDENKKNKNSGDKTEYFVKWTLENPENMSIAYIKKMMQHVTELSSHKIIFVYAGSVQIESSVSYDIVLNPEKFAASILTFLAKFTEICKIDTSKDMTIDVDIAVSELPWRAYKDKSKDRSVRSTCDELQQIVHAYLSHNHKSWKRCASLSQPTVEIKSTKQQQFAMTGKKRKSKSQEVFASKRKRSEVSFSESFKEEEPQPSTSGSLPVGEGYITWSEEDVAMKLEDYSFNNAAKVFREEGISGEVLDMLNEEQLEKMGITKIGERLKIMKVIRKITGVIDFEEHQKKIFNDPVNGHTEVHPLCIKIIDTPQFQRLRDLKQSGTCYFVYPGATNNRFEHCIGVCYLAGQLVRMLQKRQPELNITNKDILCVEIAGLCHDLGHGPFSHLFDSKFIPAVRPTSKWKHEDASVMMFDYLIEKHNLMGEFKKYDLIDKDIKFIKEQIEGPKQNREQTAGHQKYEKHIGGLKIEESVWPYHGRDQSKGFLYEIVANKRNGIDVDKWDYFARDCYGLGIKNTFDHNRFMKFARVLKVKDEYQICSRDKEAETLYGMFQIRATLHRRAYQHRVCDAIEAMVTDAFIAADHKGIIPGKDGNLKKLSECIDDPEAYTNLSDSIFHVILMSVDKGLEKSRKILQRIMHRQLYACVGETTPTEGETYEKSSQVMSEIISNIPPESKGELLEDALYVDLVYLDYGSKSKNPMTNVRFYNKRDVTKPVRIDKNQVSLMLPNVFSEQIVRLYCKKNDSESLKIASDCFKKWCQDNNLLLQIKVPEVVR